MVWNMLTELDTLDMVIFAGLAIGGLYFLYSKFLSKPEEKYKPNIVAVQPRTERASSVDDTSFTRRMKNGERTVAIFYGSQTGTAEELAGRLAKDAKRYGLKALVLDPEECDMEELPKLKEIDNSFAIFCMATYGEGDPTDNAQRFHEMLTNGDFDLTGNRYAVFGLGNKTYEHYNEIGKICDKKLEELGAERIFELGLGDDDGNLEEDFMRWRELFWPRVCDVFNLKASGDDMNTRQYRFESIADPNPESVFKGEMGRLGAYQRQRPPFDAKNPYMSNVVSNRELHKGGDRSCRHIEFDIEGSRLRYEAGDHCAVFPTNNPELVETIGRLLSVDLDAVFKLINTDEESSKKHPFPCPCSYRTALTHYVDIVSPLKTHVIKEISAYATDEKEKAYLQKLSSSNEEGLKEYHTYIQSARRSIVDILSNFPSCRPPLDHVLELLPRLQARYYSISSSPKADASKVSITAVVLEYKIQDRTIRGVCTNYLKNKVSVGEVRAQVPMFIRKSTLRLPHRTTTPVIMLGPGTGFAPFRGFIQDRQAAKDQGKEIGPMVLFFGCRRQDEDYIYEDELQQWLSAGTLTEIHLAFSRQTNQKVYVQHKLWEERTKIWKMINTDGAHIYVCGDARNMARDVQETFKRICIECGGMEEEPAIKYMKDMERQKRYQADVWF